MTTPDLLFLVAAPRPPRGGGRLRRGGRCCSWNGSIRPAFWRRALWQGAVISLLLLTASELSGFGRGLASFLFGHARPEQKFAVWTSPAESAASAAAIAAGLLRARSHHRPIRRGQT